MAARIISERSLFDMLVLFALKNLLVDFFYILDVIAVKNDSYFECQFSKNRYFSKVKKEKVAHSCKRSMVKF